MVTVGGIVLKSVSIQLIVQKGQIRLCVETLEGKSPKGAT